MVEPTRDHRQGLKVAVTGASGNVGTALRATGAGAAAGFGRIASIVAPLCVPPLLAAGGTGLVFGTFAAFFVLAALAAIALPERRGEPLEAVG